jgi:hypothetical protein
MAGGTSDLHDPQLHLTLFGQLLPARPQVLDLIIARLPGVFALLRDCQGSRCLRLVSLVTRTIIACQMRAVVGIISDIVRYDLRFLDPTFLLGASSIITDIFAKCRDENSRAVTMRCLTDGMTAIAGFPNCDANNERSRALVLLTAQLQMAAWAEEDRQLEEDRRAEAAEAVFHAPEAAHKPSRAPRRRRPSWTSCRSTSSRTC